MLSESLESVSSIGSKMVRSSFLKYVLLWAARVVSYIFYLVNLKLVSRPTRISTKPRILLSGPLKYDSLGNVVNINISRNCNSHNQDNQFKKSDKNLSTMNVLN